MSLALQQRPPVMCLTQDGLPWSHVEQARRLCAGGARWIQLRMKSADAESWRTTAKEVVAVCRQHGALCVINDSVEIAIESGADGVHLGKLDLDWNEARRRLGTNRILGGTVNNSVDADRATKAGCLDYVGVGPWRFTTNKVNLAPVLGADGIRKLMPLLGDLPAWVIGAIEVDDLSAVRATGAAGVAVSSALFRDDALEKNHLAFINRWNETIAPPLAVRKSAASIL